MSRLSKRAWESDKLTTKTKILVYNACVLSTLLCVQRDLDNFRPTRTSPPTASIMCVAYDASGVYPGRTRMSSSGRTLQVCSRCCPRDAYAGSAMSSAWRMDAFLLGELGSGSKTVDRPMLRYKDVRRRGT